MSVLMNLRVPRNAGNFLSSCKPVSFSRRAPHLGVSKYIDRTYCGGNMQLTNKLRGKGEFCGAQRVGSTVSTER